MIGRTPFTALPDAAQGVMIRVMPGQVRRTQWGHRAMGCWNAIMLNRIAVLLLTIALALPVTPSRAQQDDAGGSGISFVTPFPESDTYKLQVYGDAFAEGLLAGLIEAFPNERGLQIAKKHRPLGALVRPEHDDEIKGEELSREVVHIGVVMLGFNDRAPIRLSSTVRPLQMTSEDWQTEYGRRVDRLLKALKKRSIAVYLVGQPIMRNSGVNRDAAIITEVMRERALQNGVRFIDISEGFADENGDFSQFGPDLSGARQKLREGDGIMFTGIGNRKLAHFVESDIRRDMAQAKAERAIPLAGSDIEQNKINPAKAAGQLAAAGSKSATVKEQRVAGQPKAQPTAAAPVAVDTTGDQKADNSRISFRSVGAGNREELLTVDIVRPALTGAVVALVTRREVAERAVPALAEGLIDDIGDGLTVVSTMSAPADTVIGPGSARRSAPNTVLVKGERLASKPGRADDHSWPRKDQAVVAPAPVAAPTLRPAPQVPPARPPARGPTAPKT